MLTLSDKHSVRPDFQRPNPTSAQPVPRAILLPEPFADIRGQHEKSSVDPSHAITRSRSNRPNKFSPDSARADPYPEPDQHRATRGAAESPEKYRRRR